MRNMVNKILNQYGNALTLAKEDGDYQIQAFFQPVRSKSWQYLEGNYSPLGELSRGQYVYIGPLEPFAEPGDTVTADGKHYWLRRSETIYGPEGPVYCWGLCVEKGGEDNWGQS